MSFVTKIAKFWYDEGTWEFYDPKDEFGQECLAQEIRDRSHQVRTTYRVEINQDLLAEYSHAKGTVARLTAQIRAIVKCTPDSPCLDSENCGKCKTFPSCSGG
jgi:hypothetical protein